jgi:hypothetical protein
VKRAIYILLGLSLVTALLVLLFRRGGSEEPSPETEPQPSPAATAPALARGPLPPPVFVRPDGGSAHAAEPEPPDAALSRQVRNLVKTDPAKVVELAREGRRLYGDSRYSDDYDSFLVQAYINLHDMAAARAEMPYYYEHHPHGRWGNYLFALTNVGPNPPAGPQP